MSFYMKTSKTDVEAKGREFNIINGSMGEKTVGAWVMEYIRVLGLRKNDFLFPKVKGDGLDKKKYMGYAAAFATLESLKTELRLNQKIDNA